MELLGHEGASGAHASGDGKASKKDSKKQTILVITGVVGVALTYLLYRHAANNSGATAATATQGAGATPGGDAGGDAGGTTDEASAFNTIGSQLSSLQTAVAGLQTTVTGQTKTIATDTATNKSQASQITSLTKALAALKAQEAKVAKQVHATPKKSSVHASGSASAASHSYTVKSGDNLSKIAARYHETLKQLEADNKKAIGSNPNLIHPGLKLKVK